VRWSNLAESLESLDLGCNPRLGGRLEGVAPVDPFAPTKAWKFKGDDYNSDDDDGEGETRILVGVTFAWATLNHCTWRSLTVTPVGTTAELLKRKTDKKRREKMAAKLAKAKAEGRELNSRDFTAGGERSGGGGGGDDESAVVSVAVMKSRHKALLELEAAMADDDSPVHETGGVWLLSEGEQGVDSCSRFIVSRFRSASFGGLLFFTSDGRFVVSVFPFETSPPPSSSSSYPDGSEDAAHRCAGAA